MKKNSFLIFIFNTIAILFLMLTNASLIQKIGISLIILTNVFAIVVIKKSQKEDENEKE